METSKKSITRISIGLVITALGFGIIAANLGFVDVSIKDIWVTYWPLLLIIGGILILIDDVKSYTWALLVIAIGVIFQIDRLVDLPTSPWNLLWPLVIVFVGLSIILEGSSKRKNKVSKADKDTLTAILGGTNKRNISDNYKGSEITAIMGGAKLDLRKATIKERAELSVTVVMGGLELIVPRNIIIHNETSAILGGVEDESDQDEPKKGGHLYINGDVIMGGVTIKN